MRDYIILYFPLNFVFMHIRPLTNKPHHIIEISGKKLCHYSLIIAVLIMVGVKKVHKTAGEMSGAFIKNVSIFAYVNLMCS